MISEEKYTRCPGCHTVFRVTSQQLAMRGGQVRCGHCKTVFDGTAERISLAPQTGPREDDSAYDEAVRGPPTVTLRSAQALHPVVPEPAPPEADTAAPAEEISKIAYEERFAWAGKKKRQRRAAGPIYAFAVPVLLLLLAGQAIFYFRETITARWPATKPLLSSASSAAGFSAGAVRATGDELSIDASDLQADPAHKGLLILTASVRNRARWPRAYPYLELTLTDASDATVVRRALAPSDYAGGTVEIGNGIPPNGEVAIKLFIDASATTQAGYRLYLFYP